MTTLHTVVLYTRRDCGLCDEAAVELQALQEHLGFALEERDIDAEPDLQERYNEVIPVVFADGREVVRAPFHPEELRDLLEQSFV